MESGKLAAIGAIYRHFCILSNAMFLLKLIVKILLLPVILILGVLRLLVHIGINLSSIVLGGLMLIVFGCIIFTIIQHAWNSMTILMVMEVFLVLITAGTGLMEGLLEMVSDRLGSFMRS